MSTLLIAEEEGEEDEGDLRRTPAEEMAAGASEHSRALLSQGREGRINSASESPLCWRWLSGGNLGNAVTNGVHTMVTATI